MSTLFHVLPDVTVSCEWRKTRSGFKHEAVAFHRGEEIGRTKICYLNRTWESYDYQSVLHKAIDKFVAPSDRDAARTKADEIGRGKVDESFRPARALVAIANLLGDSPAERAKLKEAAISSIPGISLPDDWSALPAEERERRLDAAASSLTKDMP